MHHVMVFIFLVILLVGIGAIVATFQSAGSNRHPALRFLAWSLIGFNILVFINFTSAYSSANLFADYADLRSSRFVHIIYPLVRIGFLGMVYALIRTSLALQEITPKPVLERRLTWGAVILIPGYAVIVSLLQITTDPMLVGLIDMIIMLAAIAALLVLLLRQLKVARPGTGREGRPILTSFSLFYLVTFSLILVINLLPEEMVYIPGMATLFLFNLFPIVWLRRYFRPETVEMVPILEDPILLDRFCEQHGISNREREIAELIVQGKSNKEIEDQLFISLNTVKNHIYRLFRKIGVNSRSQLIHLLLQEQQNRYNST